MAPSASSGASASPRALLVLNPRSGGGKVARFGLVARAESMGVQVRSTTQDRDAASLARHGIAEGAEVLAVAGGDGTVSAVAAVAAEAGRSLVVVPAGTRNHFARDLGLDTSDPAAALNALLDAEPAQVDLASVDSRSFINNVSFGVYAEALLTPGYREKKARAFASVVPGYVQGRKWVQASVDTPAGTIEHPEVVLISNNPYHLPALRGFGRRLALDTGVLGVIVLTRPAGSPADRLLQLRNDLRRLGGAGPPREGAIAWSADRVTLHGTAGDLDAGVDGEAVSLPLPVTCEIRKKALRVLLPRDRPGSLRPPRARGGRRP